MGRAKATDHAAKPEGICCICSVEAGGSTIVGHVVCGREIHLRQQERWRSRSPPQSRRHCHLPPRQFHQDNVWLGRRRGGGLGSRPSRLARKPLVGTRRQDDIGFPSSVTSTMVDEAEKQLLIDRGSPTRVHRIARRIAQCSEISMYP